MTGYCTGAPDTYNGVGVYTYMESGPTAGLAHGEAIKLFSLFYNEEAKGNELFQEIEVHNTLNSCDRGAVAVARGEITLVHDVKYVTTASTAICDSAVCDVLYTEAVVFYFLCIIS